MIIDAHKTDKEHLRLLLNQHALQPFAITDFDVNTIAAVVPGAGNGNSNTSLAISAAVGSPHLGSGLFYYNRAVPADHQPQLSGKVIPFSGDETPATLGPKIIHHFGYPANTDYSSISRLPLPGKEKTYSLSMHPQNYLFQPGTRSFTVRNADTVNVPPDSLVFYMSARNFLDRSELGNLVGAAGATSTGVTISTAQSLFGGKSLAFDGTGWVRFLASEAQGFATGDFTLEFWFRQTTAVVANMFNQRTGSTSDWFYHLDTGGVLSVGYSRGGPGTVTLATGVALNTWNHVATTRQGNTLRHFFNGKLVSTQTTGVITASPSVFSVGGFRNGADTSYAMMLVGFMDQICIYKGLVKYTEDFTPGFPLE